MSTTGQTGSRGAAPARTRSTPTQERLRSFRRLWLRRPAQEDVFSEGAPPYVVLRRDSLYRRMLALGDLLSAATALLVAVAVLGSDGLKPNVLLIAPLMLIVVKTIGLYDRDQHLLHKSTLDEGPKLFQVSTVFVLAIWLSAPLCISGSLGRLQVAGLWVLLFALLVLTRAGVRRLATAATTAERCLIIGDEAVAKRLASKTGRTALLKVEIIGRIPLAENGDDPAVHVPLASPASPVLGTLGQLPELVDDLRIDRVIIAPGTQESDELLDLIRTAKALGVKVSIVPRLFEVIGVSVAFDEVEGLPLLGVRPYGLSTSSALLKRTFDMVVSGLLLALLFPLFLLAALAIEITSPGPVFFRQRRIGQHEQQFDMLKFRTMVPDAEEQKLALRDRNESQGLFKIADDPRITPVGRLLRRTSLDELPQLVNVLRGEMSLVGPRPLVPEEDAMIGGFNRRRLRMPPGMTGQWQILGSARIPLNEMVKIDYLYGANWSLWGDLKILLRTAGVVLARRGL